MNETLWKLELKKLCRERLAGVLGELLPEVTDSIDRKLRIAFGSRVGVVDGCTAFLYEPEPGSDISLVAVRSGLNWNTERVTVLHEFAHWIATEFLGEKYGHGARWGLVLVALRHKREARRFCGTRALPRWVRP